MKLGAAFEGVWSAPVLAALITPLLLAPEVGDHLLPEGHAPYAPSVVERTETDLDSIPLYFIENRGQLDGRVKYYIQGAKTSVYFEPSGITFGIGDRHQRWAVKIDFVDANLDASLQGTQKTQALVSYFRGERARWQTAVPTYGQLVYRDLWPGIDLVYGGSQSRLKYTFHVRPGADPARIRLAVRGATDLRVTESGTLRLATPAGGFDDDRPYAFQERNGEQNEIDSAYVVEQRGDTFFYGFHLGAYDESLPLVLDPVVLAYCGYLGGAASDTPQGITVDAAGNAYVVGYTASVEPSFPVLVGPDVTYNGGVEDAFVAKVDKSGKSLVYVGYIGGSGTDRGNGVALDGAGNAYVIGETTSTEASFPVTIGPDLTFNGVRDAFVAKVNPTGTSLVFCGYLGGTNEDYGNAIAVDGSGNAYLTGQTGSSEASFPAAVGPDLSFNGGLFDAFVAKLNPAGTAFSFVGYIGGANNDYGNAVAVDTSGNAYVAGNTDSTEASFPVLVGPDTSYNGGSNDAFLTKVDATGTSLVFCGYIGGNAFEQAFDLTLDASRNVYLAGGTTSTEASFPVVVGPDLTANGGVDAFVAKVDASGAALVYCGFIGGSTTDSADGIAVDGSGNVYVTGNTDSTEASFPVKGGPDLTYNGGIWDVFVAKVSPTGTSLVYAGYLGGSGTDDPGSLALDAGGNIYITGSTGSTEASFPVTLGPDLTANGGTDGFVARIAPASPVRLVGFETADAFEIVSFGTGAGIDGITVRSGSGIFSMRQGSNPSVFASGLSLDQLGLRFSFLKPSNPGGTQTLIQFKAGAVNRWALELRTDGLLQVREDEALGFPATRWGSTPLVNSAWHTVRVLYDRRAGGVVKVWRDGSLEIDVTHSTAGTTIDAIEVVGAIPLYNYDDFYLVDVAEPPPFGQIVRLAPNGPGLSTQFDTPVPLPSHELNVDEPSPDDADYNQHGASTSAADLYALTDSPVGVINAVKAMWRLRRGNGSGAGGTHDYAWAIDGTIASRELVGLGTTFTDQILIWTSPPESGERWTEAKVSGLELGARHNGTQAQDTDLSWTGAMVDYDVTATAVRLVSFTATPFDRSVALEWRTGSEWNNVGFHIYRATTAEGDYRRLTDAPVPGLGSSPEGATYRYVDDDLVNGETYFYRLEDLEVGGNTTLHGPVSATPEATSPERDPVASAPATPRIVYGDPSANRLQVVRHGAELLLVLETRGFSMTAEEDGLLRLEVPDFVLEGDVSDRIPVRRQWVEIPSGGRVELRAARLLDRTRFTIPLASVEPSLDAGASGSVRAGRRKGRLDGSRETPVAAEVLTVGFQGEVRKALVQMAPFRYDERTNELLLARRLEVRLSLDESQPSEPRLRLRARSRTPSEGEPRRARDPAMRLIAVDPGLYALRYEDVFGGEGGRHRSETTLRLSRLGEPVPFHLEPANAPFRRGSTLYFLSEGAAANPYGREAVYELAFGEGGRSMPVDDGRPRGDAPLESYLHREEKEENRYYQASLPDPSWLWDVIPSSSIKRYPVSVSALAPAPEAILEVQLQGTSDFPVPDDHHLRLSLNGLVVGETRFDGRQSHNVVVPLPAGSTMEGNNVLEIENVGDTGAGYSMVMLDRFSLSYARRPVALDGEIRGRWNRTGEVAVEGLSHGYVVDVTDARTRWVAGARADETGRLRFHADGGRSYLVTTTTHRPSVIPASPRRWTIPSRQADYLILGPRSFLSAMGPLAEARRSQGLSVQLVPVEAIYDELGFGEARPEAITEFLRYAYHQWKEPSPRYVLLVGDGTYDFKDYLGTGVVNRVPPLLVHTRYLWTASDPSYAAVHGDDPLPDLAIGRLPAANAAELVSMVRKLLAYEPGMESRGESVVLVTDNPDRAGNFDRDAFELMTSVLGARATRHLSLSSLGPEHTRESIVQAFDDGALLMSYMGHGGIHLWADENVFQIGDVASLAPQSQQPILLTMNCLNGYFHFPYFDSLAEALLKADGRGVVAAVSPSGLSRNEPAHLFHRLLLEEILNGESERLGDALLAAQRRYADAGATTELLQIYHLFGDPGLRIR